MRTTTLLSCITTLASATLYEYPSEFQFRDLLQTHPRLFISFTSSALDSIAPLNNIFTQAATNLSTPFVTIDCHIGISLCQDYHVNSFPTFRLLESSIEGGKKMKETRYRGPRTVAGMKSFVKKREIPDLSKLAREDMDFRRVDDIVFIAFLDPSDTSHLATFSSIAQEHHLDFAFGYTTDISLAAKEKIQAPSVICYRNLNGDNIILSGAFTFADVEKFLLAAQKSVVKDFREKDIDVFMQRDKLTVYIFTTSTDHKSIRHELTLLAKGFERHVTVAIVDLARYPEMPANFGTEVQGEQALVVHAPLDDQIFRYKQTKKIESAVVEDMLMTILQGKAVNGQVFGEDAADVSAGGDADTNEEDGHDEL